jgi:hypothetical protein
MRFQASALVAAALALAAPAHAQQETAGTTPLAVAGEPVSSKAFLAALAGDWRGAGEASMNPRSKPTRVSCRLNAVFDSVQSVLTNNGRCGTTQGARDVKGTLAATDDDGLSGAFIAGLDTEKLQKQSLRYADNMLVAEGEMPDGEGGKVTRLRTFLTLPRDGAFVVQNQFYDWAKAAWVVAGEIEFRREQ